LFQSTTQFVAETPFAKFFSSASEVLNEFLYFSCMCYLTYLFYYLAEKILLTEVGCGVTIKNFIPKDWFWVISSNTYRSLLKISISKQFLARKCFFRVNFFLPHPPHIFPSPTPRRSILCNLLETVEWRLCFLMDLSPYN
jgi:hypothetical protein